MTGSPPPRITENLPRLRQQLADAAYTAEGIRSVLDLPPDAQLPVPGHHASLVRARLSGSSRAHVLTRLALLGEVIDHNQAATLPSELIDLLLEARLVSQTDSGGLRPQARLSPFGRLLLAADVANEGDELATPDVVENPHGPTNILSQLVPRDRVHRALDIGAGTGVHALEAAAHANAVTGTEISPRALDFARFNAALNGITNVEFQQADVTAGLDDVERFDLIVSNPPYLLSPENELLYRDGAKNARTVGERVLLQAPRLLSSNGILVCLASWSITDPLDCAQAIRSVAARVNCDGFAFVYAIRSPLRDAICWNAHAERGSMEKKVRSWVEFHRELGTDSVAYGLVVLTPSATRTTEFRFERVSLDGLRPDGGQLKDLLAALRCRAAGELPRSMHLHPEHEIRSVSRIVGGRRVMREQVVQSTRGIPFTVDCGPRLLDLLAGARPDSREPGGDVLSSMRGRLFDLGLVVSAEEGQ